MSYRYTVKLESDMTQRKKRILILGRTGSGKDTAAGLFENRGYKKLKSFATRPKRSQFEDTHTFISPEEVSKYSDEMVAYTTIGEYEYFGTVDQLRNSDIYIIDPKGLNYLLWKTSDEFDFIIIYVKASPSLRMKRASQRGKDKAKLRKDTIKRNKDEDERFSRFEKDIKDGLYTYSNKSYMVEVIENNADIGILETKVDKIIREYFR